jgi:hypothetical protein
MFGYRVAAASFMGERVGVGMVLAPVSGTLWVEPDGSDGIPVSSLARPSGRVPCAGCLIYFRAPAQHGLLLTGMPGVRDDKADGAMPMLGVAPANEGINPGTRLLDRREATGGPRWDVFAGPEERLGERIVVRHPWPAEGENDAKTAHRCFHGRTASSNCRCRHAAQEGW